MGRDGTSAKFRQFANFIFSGNFFFSEIFQKFSKIFLEKIRRAKKSWKTPPKF